MIPRSIAELDAADLARLVDVRQGETLTLEFKRDLPGNDRASLVEFLADVSAFANRSGGDLVIGIDEETTDDGDAVASAIVPIDSDDIDGSVRRLEDLVRSSIKPRILGLRIQAVRVDSDRGGYAVVVRVPRSWNGPHVVEHSGHWRFYVRTSRGKHQMDISEVRAAFDLTASIGDRLTAFRRDRVDTIRAEIDLGNQVPTILVHVMPLSAFEPDAAIDLLCAADSGSRFHSLDWTQEQEPQNLRYRFDGLEWSGRDARDGTTVLYRTGIVEGIDRLTLTRGRPNDRTASAPQVQVGFPQRILEGVLHYLNGLRELELEGPVALAVTLFCVGGLYLEAPARRGMEGFESPRSRHPVDRNDLVLPVRLLASPADDPKPIVQEYADMIWNAAGEPASPTWTADDRSR